ARLEIAPLTVSPATSCTARGRCARDTSPTTLLGRAPMSMFTFLGSVLASYVCYAVATGRVWAKAGVVGGAVWRSLAPGDVSTVMSIYSALSGALVFVF